LLIGVGALSVIISLLIIANPIRFGVGLLAIMLAAVLLIGGVETIALGARGGKKESITPSPSPSPSPSSSSSPPSPPPAP
jgi:hypothetical protein